MKTICAWCNTEIYEDPDVDDGMISHGICLECQAYFFPTDGNRSFVEFLDLLSVPVIVVDENVKLVATNKMARRLLGKSERKIKGMHFGEAAECPYARLPGGCGQTVHCKSCTVRLTVQDTYATGRSHYDVPAYQDVNFAKEAKSISFLISTEKLGEIVFLKIQEVEGKGCEQEAPRGFNRKG